MTSTFPAEQVLGVLRDLARDVGAAENADGELSAFTASCLRCVPAATAAGITSVQGDSVETLAPTDALAERVDRLQWEVGSGPCLDAAVQDRVFRANDLRADERWPVFGARAADELGVRSMLSYRLYFEDADGSEPSAALNLYSTEVDAFDDEAQLCGLAASAYGASLVSRARLNREVAHLQRALATNREIGAAIGVLMAVHKVTREQAFDLLRMASQNTHRRLADIARDVVDTGALDIR